MTLRRPGADLPAHSVDETPRSLLRGTRILVVEDNQINRLVVVRQLQTLGYPTDTVVNGREALQAVENGSYALVLMDCQMPVMDGYQATAKIRRGKNGRHIPIIALTAHALEEDRVKCMAAGMNGYISKPLQLADLRAILRQWVGGPRAGRVKKLPPAAVSAPVDLEQLKQLTSLESKKIDNLILLYLQDTDRALHQLKRAIQVKSVRHVKELAHACLGASKMLGITAMVAPFEQLERLGQQSQLALAEHYLHTAKAELERVKRYLQQLKTTASPSRKG